MNKPLKTLWVLGAVAGLGLAVTAWWANSQSLNLLNLRLVVRPPGGGNPQARHGPQHPQRLKRFFHLFNSLVKTSDNIMALLH